MNWPRLHRPFQRASLASSPRPSSEERAEGTPLTSTQQPKPLVSRSPAPLLTQKPSVTTYTHIGDTSRDHPSPQPIVTSHDNRTHYTVRTTVTKNDTGAQVPMPTGYCQLSLEG